MKAESIRRRVFTRGRTDYFAGGATGFSSTLPDGFPIVAVSLSTEKEHFRLVTLNFVL